MWAFSAWNPFTKAVILVPVVVSSIHVDGLQLFRGVGRIFERGVTLACQY